MGQHHAAGAPLPRRLRRVSALVGLALLSAGSLFAAVPAVAQTADAGQVRLGHLSPSTPAVDIYLTAPGEAPSREPLVAGAGYGAVTPYQPLATGRWTVEMRSAGAAPDSAPPLTSAVDVAPGSAQSLLFFDTGALGSVQGQLLTDDLDPAAAGTGRMRIVQGAGGEPVDMQAAGGPTLATGLEYGTVTDYASVGARSWDIAIASGSEQQQITVAVAEGSVSTVVLSRDAAGALVVTPLTDVEGAVAPVVPSLPGLDGPPVAGPGEPQAPAETAPPVEAPAPSEPQMPQGGVPAGAGATAGSVDALPVLLAIGGAVLLVFAVSGSRRPARTR